MQRRLERSEEGVRCGGGGGLVSAGDGISAVVKLQPADKHSTFSQAPLALKMSRITLIITVLLS